MFIMSLNLTKNKIILLVALILCVVSLILMLFKSDYSENVFSPNKTKYPLVKTNEDMVNFFMIFGWEVEKKPLEIVDIKIPEKFDAVYENYEKLQNKAGLSLLKYRGVNAKRYTYRVTNHILSEKEVVRGNLIVYKNKVIAGDISSVRLDGFMHALNGHYEEKTQ